MKSNDPSTRRGAATLLLVAAMSLGANTACVTRMVGGAFTRAPEDLPGGLSPGAQRLLDLAYRDIEPGRVTDHHVHLLGMGSGGTGAFVNPSMRSWQHPMRRFKFQVYKSAAGIHTEQRADDQYLDRLVALVRNQPGAGRFHLLAFDQHYTPDGRVDLARTEFHVPNDYVVEVAEAYPDLFEPVGSVHPNREDALEELEWLASRGVRWIKWLPNSMGIDPADARHDAFYDRMRALDMVLLCHVGHEHAVDAGPFQELGNPLRLRRPLDRGVKVVAAHLGSSGETADLDNPAGGAVSSFALFLRLMDEPRYDGLLFGEISAVTLSNRAGGTLPTLLSRQDLHHRLVNGSDYPLPAVHALVRTGALVEAGYLTAEERVQLREIYDFNPLLFDFVLKRTLRMPGTGQRLSAGVFMRNRGLEPRRTIVAVE